MIRVSSARGLEIGDFQIIVDSLWVWSPRNPYWTRCFLLGWVTVILPGSHWRAGSTSSDASKGTDHA